MYHHVGELDKAYLKYQADKAKKELSKGSKGKGKKVKKVDDG